MQNIQAKAAQNIRYNIQTESHEFSIAIADRQWQQNFWQQVRLMRPLVRGGDGGMEGDRNSGPRTRVEKCRGYICEPRTSRAPPHAENFHRLRTLPSPAIFLCFVFQILLLLKF